MWIGSFKPKCQNITISSDTAEESRDALRHLKYYGRFLTELLARRSANPQEPCEHTVSWNRVKCCTNVRRIAFENVCKRWMTFKVVQGHCRCYHLIGHILFPISLPLFTSVCQSCTVFQILTLICQKLRRHVTLTTPIWGQFVIITKLILFASTSAQNLTILSSAIPVKFKGV